MDFFSEKAGADPYSLYLSRFIIKRFNLYISAGFARTQRREGEAPAGMDTTST